MVSLEAERMPNGVESRQARGVAGTYTAISEAVARRMVESAGFDPGIVSWATIAGEVGSVLRLLAEDEMGF